MQLTIILKIKKFNNNPKKKIKIMETQNLKFTAEEEKEIEKRFQNADVISKLTDFLKRDDIYMYLSAEDEYMLSLIHI